MGKRKRCLLTKIMMQLLIVAFLSLGIAVMAQADITATWNFAAPPGGDTGLHSKTYLDTTSGLNVPLPATAFTTTNNSLPLGTALGTIWNAGTITNSNLFEKFTLGDPTETGLGITGKPASEIQATSFIQLDTGPMKAGFMAKDLTLKISSIQAGEGYELFGSNAAGVPGELLKIFTSAGPTTDSFLVPDFKMFEFFSIAATPIQAGLTSSDVLIMNGATATVPIPPSAILLGSGLLGLVAFRFRKNRG